uniref:Uncharacterized protein n=1 Tax=Nelumbo nucifera TaxID=4432 RepID=A0A822ZHT9_NELNU|nr:TPA_asm: hypothetical protein HUJ06_001245 [Nelumbo nucifera]
MTKTVLHPVHSATIASVICRCRLSTYIISSSPLSLAFLSLSTEKPIYTWIPVLPRQLNCRAASKTTIEFEMLPTSILEFSTEFRSNLGFQVPTVAAAAAVHLYIRLSSYFVCLRESEREWVVGTEAFVPQFTLVQTAEGFHALL